MALTRKAAVQAGRRDRPLRALPVHSSGCSERQLIPARGLPEPQPLGRQGLPGDHHPAHEIRRLPLRTRGCACAQPLCRVLTRALHRRHPRGAREVRCAVGRGPSGLSPQARVLKGGDGADRRDTPGRRRPPARERLRLCAGDHGRRPVETAAGSAPGDRGKGEGVARNDVKWIERSGEQASENGYVQRTSN